MAGPGLVIRPVLLRTRGHKGLRRGRRKLHPQPAPSNLIASMLIGVVTLSEVGREGGRLTGISGESSGHSVPFRHSVEAMEMDRKCGALF